MRAIAIIAALAAALGLAAVSAWPDVRRYMAMRRM
jgi:hypothetical protein